MNRRTGIAASVLLMLALLAAPVSLGRTVHIGPDQTTGTLLAIGDRVVVEGTVHGDLWVLSPDLLVTGNVTGDLTAAGGSMTIDGRIDGGLDVLSAVLVLGTGSTVSSVDARSGATVMAGHVRGTATIDGVFLFVTGPTHISGDLRHTAEDYRGSGRIDGRVTRIPDTDDPVLAGRLVLSAVLPLPIGPVA